MKSPIFILSTSPRTGSTWLQRILTSTSDVLIWGENTTLTFPYGDHWTPNHDGGDANDLHFFRKHKANMRMASLSPLFSDIFPAQKKFLEALYGDTAKREGYLRWGVKETYWTDITLKFINWAWPDCKILFLTRGFTEAFCSNLKTLGWRGVTQTCCRRGDVQNFCSNWLRQTKMILDYLQQPSNGMLVRYEDLLDDHPYVKQVCASVGLLHNPHWGQIASVLGSAKPTFGGDYSITDPADLLYMLEYTSEIRDLSARLGHPEPTYHIGKRGGK